MQFYLYAEHLEQSLRNRRIRYFPGCVDGGETQKSQRAAGAMKTQCTLHSGALHGPESRRGLHGWVSLELRLERAVRGLCGPLREHLSFGKTGVCETACVRGDSEDLASGSGAKHDLLPFRSVRS